MPDDIQLDYRGRPRSDSQTEFLDQSLTIQSDAPEADIQLILKKYREVGIIDNLNLTEASFMDVTEFTDFADLMRQTKIAENEFMKLPSKVREIFNHDVANWLDTAHDEEKRASLIEAGIIEPEQQPGTGDQPPDGGTDPNPGPDSPDPV